MANPVLGIYGGIRIGQLFKTVERVEIPVADYEFETYGEEFSLPCVIDNIRLPNEPLISIKGNKRIIKTAVPGLAGEVIEHIQLGSYKITIKGIAVNAFEDDLPQEEIRDIRELCEKLGSLKITNRLLTYFDIDHIVITDFDFPAVEGMQNAQLYVINAISTKPIDLIKIADQ